MGGGGSSGGGGTTQSVSNSYSSLSPWAAPYVTSMLGAAQQQVFQTNPTDIKDAQGNVVTPAGQQITGMNPYNAFGSYNATGGQYGINPSAIAAANSSVAQFSPLQQQSFNAAGNLQTPGQYGQATGATQYGIGNALNMSANATPQDFQNQVGGYMNPYIQNALNPALQLANQQYGIAGQQAASQATGQGAFGGTRSALQQGLNQQNQMLAQNQLIGNAYNQAFNAAQNQYNQSGQFALNANQAAMQNAAQLANIGGQQLGAQQNIINQQNQLGQQGTAQQQAIINQAMQNYQTGQQYPFQQLQNLKNLAAGIPVTDTTQNVQTAAPSTANLIGGAGMTGLGIAAMTSGNNGPTYNINTSAPQVAAAKAGGIMSIPRTKKYVNGGIGSIYRKAINDPASVPDQSLKDGTINGLPAQLVQAMKTNEQMQAQAPAQAPTSTVIQDVDAKAAQQQAQEQAIDEQKLLTQLPTIMADLKVARDIAKEKGDKEEVKAIDQKIMEISMLAQQAQEKMQMQPAQGPGPMTAPAPQGIEAAMAQQQQAAQQPQQMAQAAPQQAPQGIAQFYKGGEVKRYANNPTPTIADEGDASGIFPKIGTGISNWFKGTVGALDPNAPTITPNAPNQISQGAVQNRDNYRNAPVANPTKPYSDSEITIGPRGGPSVKASDAAKELNIAQYDVKGATNDVTNMINNWSNMLMKQYGQDSTMKDIGRGLIAGGSAWSQGINRNTGLANAIGAFGPTYLQSAAASEDKKDKLLTQMMGLGLSGAQLKMEAAKLGISQEDLRAKLPMYKAAAEKDVAYANYLGRKGSGSTTGAGYIPAETTRKLYTEYKGYISNPKQAPADLYNQLTETDKLYLEKPNTPSGQEAVRKWKGIVAQEYNNIKSEIKSESDKRQPVVAGSGIDSI